MIKINGNSLPCGPGKTVEALLAEQGYVQGRIAVERNGEILPKARYSQTLVEDGDVYEVVNFVGGG